jgi:radical SAM superfamily enzyme YgiQ (UPF0313 family)
MLSTKIKLSNYLLISPPVEWSSAGKKSTLTLPTVPPLGLLYVGQSLLDEGYNVTVIDYNAERIDRKAIEKAVRSCDIIGITVFSTSLINTQFLIKQIRKVAPDKPIIIGGPHCGVDAKQALVELDADISVSGDGEKAIKRIAKAVEGKNHLSEVAGVYYKTKDNKIKSGPAAKLIPDLDTIAFPAHQLVKRYGYGQFYKRNLKIGEFATIVTARGCPWNCGFCTRPIQKTKSIRERSVENVIREIEALAGNGYKMLMIADDSFLTKPRRARKIMAEIAKRKLSLEIFIQGARVDSVDEELYQTMKNAGVKGIMLGIESGNQSVLDFYGKKTTIRQAKETVQLCKKMGFLVLGHFILGAPFETKKHFQTTIDFARALPLDGVTFFPLEYRRGSRIWREAIKNNQIPDKGYSVPAGREYGLAKYSSQEIAEICRKAQLQFYLRPSYLLTQLAQVVKQRDFTLFKAALNLFITRNVGFLLGNIRPK